MTRTELVDRIAYSNRLPRPVAEEAVRVMLQAVEDALVAGGGAEFRGFGSFRVQRYAAYTGRNPRTGEDVEVPAQRRALFRPGRRLKEALALSLED